MMLASMSASGDPVLDATVENSNGSTVQLRSLWKRPAVLFYEDRDSTELNAHVKTALFEQGRARGMLTSVTVVAVANVAAYNWFPARNFVLAAVRDSEKKFSVPIYLDFTGGLTRAPWNLPAKSSTVVAVDATGVARFVRKGRLSEADVVALFEQLEALVAEAKPEGDGR